MIGAALTATALVGLTLPGVREWLRRPIARDRDGLDASFVKLSKGRTHYTWHGRDRGPVIVCVHGLTTPSPVWGGLIPHLTGMGYRVLTYDLYGRGLSDRPRGFQTADFFVDQLTELLAALEVTEDVTLIGYSMGGGIATAFAAAHPDRLRHLVLIAPAGMEHDLGWLARIAPELPVLGDWLFHTVYPHLLRRSVLGDPDDPVGVPGIKAVQLQELARRGFLRSVLSSLRGMMRRPMQAHHTAIRQSRLPVSAIFGERDSVIPLRALGTLTQWNRHVHQEVIKNAEHGLVYTHPTDVAEALRQALLVDRRV